MEPKRASRSRAVSWRLALGDTRTLFGALSGGGLRDSWPAEAEGAGRSAVALPTLSGGTDADVEGDRQPAMSEVPPARSGRARAVSDRRPSGLKASGRV